MRRCSKDLPLSHLISTLEEEEADEEGNSLLLDDEADNRGQVRAAFCPDTTTRLAPDLPFVAWSDCSNCGSATELTLTLSMKKLNKEDSLSYGLTIGPCGSQLSKYCLTHWRGKIVWVC